MDHYFIYSSEAFMQFAETSEGLMEDYKKAVQPHKMAYWLLVKGIEKLLLEGYEETEIETAFSTAMKYMRNQIKEKKEWTTYEED